MLHPEVFGHTIFLKLRIGYFSDTQKPPMFNENLILNACGEGYLSLKQIFVFKYS